MLALKSWLSNFVSLAEISDEQFSNEMTFAGNKVESVQKTNGETVYEFEITSNRPDTLSIIGLAREASAVFNRPLKLPKTPQKKNLKRKPIPLTIIDKNLCPIFSMLEIDHISVKPSSKLTQRRLELSGIRPVNNIVDITNYLMLETGQPMHAFDADKLRGSLTLRSAKPKERIVPLDHKQRILQGGEIIIEDKEKLVDLAGLMGGLNSEISDKTTRVYLLIPIYDPVAIRRASKYLRLRTEASTRFEKKLDQTQTESVSVRAIELLRKESGGKQATVIVTASNFIDFQGPITISQDKISLISGRSFTREEIEKYLARVGIKKIATGFQPPAWRRDITIPVDLIEEVTRLHGYNKFQRTLPTGEIPINPDAIALNWKRIAGERCISLGYTETYASTLIGKSLIDELEFYPPEQHLSVLHPMSEDYEYMRRTVLETLIPFLKQNLVQTDKINLFELGTIFIPTKKADDLPEQPLELGLISTTNSYSEFRGQIEDIGKTLGISLEFSPANNNFGVMTNAVIVSHGEVEVGRIGLIIPSAIERDDITSYAGCLDMSSIFNFATNSLTYPQLSGYPPIVEDLTLQGPRNKFVGDVLRIIKAVSPLISQVEYIGSYHDFVTTRITFQSMTRSLTQEEVNNVKQDILEKLGLSGWRIKLATA